MPAPTDCLDEVTLCDLTQGRLDPSLRAAVEAHLGGCARCTGLIADALRAEQTPGAEPPSDGGRLAPGSVLERFIVLARVGAGVMGEVFVAHDPQLDRKVALKVLRLRGASPGAAEQLRARMYREAQALARLSHENLVGVFDVLHHGEQVVVAMEYVAGVTLRQWLRTPRSWREVVAVFAAAGRGLAAAHEAKLVHRDFKPDNLLISDAGEVKVGDFGLATLVGEEPPGLSFAGMPPPLALSTDLTEPGALVGTPAYMAPEVLAGGAATPASDQFSFCVALYEALWGQRPFPDASSVAVLLAEARNRQARPPPQNPRVPAWLKALVLRGLSPEPGQRWPSMDALVDQLRRDRAREQARRLVIGGFGVLIVALGFVVVAPHPGRCLDGVKGLDTVWNDGRRATVRSAFRATGATGADAAADAVDAALTGWLGSVREDFERQCVHRPMGVRRPPPPDFALHMACLQGLLIDARGSVAALEHADRQLVERARYLGEVLGPVASCGRVAPSAEPPDARTTAVAPLLRLRAAALRALVDARDAEGAQAELQVLLREADATGAWDVYVQALLLEASLERGRGELAAAERSARAAVVTGVRARLNEPLARAWAGLARVLAEQGKVTEAEDAVSLASAAGGAVQSAALASEVEAARTTIAGHRATNQ